MAKTIKKNNEPSPEQKPANQQVQNNQVAKVENKTTGNEVAKKPQQTMNLRSLISDEKTKQRFQEVIGKKAPAFLSSLLALANSNTDLSMAEPMSVMGSAMMSATLDLPINPNLAFAYIVPFKQKQKDGTYKTLAQFMLGAKGYIQLAMRTGQYKTINASIVYDGELVEENTFTGEFVFDNKKRKSNKIIGYVGYFKLLNGFEKYWYMTKEEIEAHGKKYSKSYDNDFGRWKKDFDAMAIKTVLKLLLSKFGILSVEMQSAIISDQAVIKDMDGNLEYIDRTDAGDDMRIEVGEKQAKEHIGFEDAQIVSDEKPVEEKPEEKQTEKKEEAKNPELFQSNTPVQNTDQAPKKQF